MLPPTSGHSGTPATPITPPVSRRVLLVGVGWLVAIAAAHLADPWVWGHVRDPRINDKDLGRLFRSFGYLPLWLLAATALYLHDRARDVSGNRGVPTGMTGRSQGASTASTGSWRRALVLALLPTLAGTAAEIGKLLVRRLRPNPEVFEYAFRAYADDLFSSRNLGIPSSHVAVAAGGALALTILFPSARSVWYIAAIGCAVVRVLALGHFASDVVAGGAIAWLIAIAFARRRSVPMDS